MVLPFPSPGFKTSICLSKRLKSDDLGGLLDNSGWDCERESGEAGEGGQPPLAPVLPLLHLWPMCYCWFPFSSPQPPLPPLGFVLFCFVLFGEIWTLGKRPVVLAKNDSWCQRKSNFALTWALPGWLRATVTLGSMRVAVERPASWKSKALNSWTSITPVWPGATHLPSLHSVLWSEKLRGWFLKASPAMTSWGYKIK